MSATNAAANAILDLISTAITWADVAEDVVSSPATAFFVSFIKTYLNSSYYRIYNKC